MNIYMMHLKSLQKINEKKLITPIFSAHSGSATAAK
jgi:hypothetical protein